MALRASDLERAMRTRLPGYDPNLVPRPALFELLSEAEAEIVAQAQSRNAHYLSQRLTVFLARSTGNDVGTAAPASGAGFPLTSAAAVDLWEPAGLVQAIDLSTPLVTPFVISGQTGTTLTKSGAGWTTNQFAGKVAVVLSGPGAGPTGRRRIVSNTSDTLTVSATLSPLTVAGSSLIGIYAGTAVLGVDGVVTGSDVVTERVSYVTKLDATGTAYLDLETPLVARWSAGIPLPSMGSVLNVEAWPTDGDRSVQLDPVAPDALGYRLRGPAYTVKGGALFLVGLPTALDRLDNLEVTYQPIPPMVTSLTQTLLVPEAARFALATAFALSVGQRLLRLDPARDPGAVIVRDLRDDADRKLSTFLDQVVGVGVATPRSAVEVW